MSARQSVQEGAAFMMRASIALLMILLAGSSLAYSVEAGQDRRHHGFSISTGFGKELRDCSQIRLTVDDEEVLRSEQARTIPQNAFSPLRIQAPHHGGISIRGWDRNEYAIIACLGAPPNTTPEGNALLDQ